MASLQNSTSGNADVFVFFYRCRYFYSVNLTFNSCIIQTNCETLKRDENCFCFFTVFALSDRIFFQTNYPNGRNFCGKDVIIRNLDYPLIDNLFCDRRLQKLWNLLNLFLRIVVERKLLAVEIIGKENICIDFQINFKFCVIYFYGSRAKMQK